jgi:hypothetical protein
MLKFFKIANFEYLTQTAIKLVGVPGGLDKMLLFFTKRALTDTGWRERATANGDLHSTRSSTGWHRPMPNPFNDDINDESAHKMQMLTSSHCQELCQARMACRNASRRGSRCGAPGQKIHFSCL